MEIKRINLVALVPLWLKMQKLYKCSSFILERSRVEGLFLIVCKSSYSNATDSEHFDFWHFDNYYERGENEDEDDFVQEEVVEITLDLGDMEESIKRFQCVTRK